MSKRQQPAQPFPPNAKRICIENVFPSEHLEMHNQTTSLPILLTFTNRLAPSSIQDMNLQLVKRKPPPHSEAPSKPEMLGIVKGKQWHARKGFHDMNSDYFVGIRNKKTNTISLVQTDGLYCMRPTAKTQAAPEEEDDSDLEEDKNETYQEKRNALIKLFGGRKSQQVMARKEKNKITEDNVDEKVTEQLGSAAKAMRKKDSEEGIHHGRAETTESLAPPHNSDATDPVDAYPLEGLITPKEMTALRTEAVSMLELVAGDESMSTMENPGWDPLVWDLLHNILTKRDMDEELVIRRMQAAMHLHYLTVMAKYAKSISARDRLQMAQDMAVDDAILECLLERFSAPFGNNRVRRQRNPALILRAVDHAILMYLTASGFENCAKLNELSKTLCTNIRTLLTQAVQLGCKVRKPKGSTGTDAYRLTLVTPLVFPEVRRKGRTPKKS